MQIGVRNGEEENRRRIFFIFTSYNEEEFKHNLKRLASYGEQCVEDLLHYLP